jgi:DNA-binding IclR family transcriptional regulator
VLALNCRDLDEAIDGIGALVIKGPTTEGSNLQTVERAVQLVRHVVFEQHVVGTRESARLLGISPSSAHRLLKTLAGLGLLEQDPISGGFRPGLELYRLAATLLSSSSLGQAAREPMRRLALETGESVFLCVRSGHSRILLDAATGPRQLQYLLRPGEEVPLHVGSSGLSILAWLPEADIEGILAGDLPAFSPKTITDPEQLRSALHEVRSQGFAVSFGHHIEDGVGISAPIFDDREQVLGSLLLTIPEARLDRHEPLDVMGRRVREVADTISLRLGGQPEY